MEHLFIIFAAIFLATFLIGKILEHFRIPWIFGGIFVGIIISFFSVSDFLINDEAFLFIVKLGMYFLLFIIGFEIDLKSIIKQNSSIFKTTVSVIALEVIFGSILLYYVFDLSWLMAVVVASSFSTVGEAVLLPILNEFKLTKDKLGQRILSVGVLDDIFEILVIVVVSIIVGGSKDSSHFNIIYNLVILGTIFLLVFILFKLHNNITNFKYRDVNSLFLFVLFFIFLFIGIGEAIDSSSLGAIFAGISLRNLVPQKKLDFIESEIKTISYGFFAPIFFVWIGLSLDLSVLLSNIDLILMVVAVTVIAKVLGSYISSHKELGFRKSIFMGLSLTVKLSTGIVVLSLLVNKGFITSELFSVLIGASIVFTILVPMILPLLIKNWVKV